jgi:hypothetical protein
VGVTKGKTGSKCLHHFGSLVLRVFEKGMAYVCVCVCVWGAGVPGVRGDLEEVWLAVVLNRHTCVQPFALESADG